MMIIVLNILTKLPAEVNLRPCKHQPHKIVKHSQPIRWQFADELFECV